VQPEIITTAATVTAITTTITTATITTTIAINITTDDIQSFSFAF
jgi:hypothetical protein